MFSKASNNIFEEVFAIHNFVFYDLALPTIDAVIPWGGVSTRGFIVRWTSNDRCTAYNVYIVRSYTNNVISEAKEVKGKEYIAS